jgi:hypothetical protein
VLSKKLNWGQGIFVKNVETGASCQKSEFTTSEEKDFFAEVKSLRKNKFYQHLQRWVNTTVSW